MSVRRACIGKFDGGAVRRIGDAAITWYGKVYPISEYRKIAAQYRRD